jgi:hypothetical protein
MFDQRTILSHEARAAQVGEHFLLRRSWHAKRSQGQPRRTRRHRSHIDLDVIEKTNRPEQEASSLINQAKEVAGCERGR